MISEGGEAKASASLFSYSDAFHAAFPEYLAMGMSADEYWNGDPALAKDYRKYYEIQRRTRNWELWMQGMYIYEALCCASPLMQAFAKRGTKAHPYASEPYPLTEKEAREKKMREEKKAMEANIEKMKAFAASYNRKFEKK